MKKLLVFLFLIVTVSSNAQIQWQWLKTSAGDNEDILFDVDVDLSGNSWVIGTFRSPILNTGCPPLYLGSFGATSDLLIVRRDPNGTCLWTRKINYDSISSEEGLKIVKDHMGNFYCAGRYDGAKLILDNDTIVNVNAGKYDLFVAKMDSTGTFLWARSLGGTGSDLLADMVVTDSGDVVISGNYRDSIEINNVSYHAINSYSQFFVAKYDKNGNHIWSTALTDSSFNGCNALATDPAGNVYIAGYYALSDIQIGTHTLSDWGSGDSFFAKFDLNGNVLWAKQVVSLSPENITDIVADHSGNFYLTCEIPNDTTYVDTTPVISSGYQNMLIAKFNLNGSLLWTKVFPGSFFKLITTAECDIDDNLYIGGMYSYFDLTFDSITITNIDPNTPDMFIAKLSPNGDAIWAKGFGGISNIDHLYSISIDNSYNVYTCGFYSSQNLQFDNLLGPPVFNPYYKYFVAKATDNILSTFASLTDYSINIYPVPATDIISVSSDRSITKIDVLDVHGRMIQDTKWNGRSIHLTASPGVYFLKIYFEKEFAVRKILIGN